MDEALDLHAWVRTRPLADLNTQKWHREDMWRKLLARIVRQMQTRKRRFVYCVTVLCNIILEVIVCPVQIQKWRFVYGMCTGYRMTDACLRMYVCVHIYIYIYIHTYINIYIYVCMYLYR